MQRLANAHKTRGTLLIVFNNDRQMQDLNLRFKRKKRPTDVLAFNLADGMSKRYIEGEVYVDLQVARRQAADIGVDYVEEIARLCLHGFMHLLGYDDKKAEDRKKMWIVQENYVKGIIDGKQGQLRTSQ